VRCVKNYLLTQVPLAFQSVLKGVVIEIIIMAIKTAKFNKAIGWAKV
jgi:hypothetical protein